MESRDIASSLGHSSLLAPPWMEELLEGKKRQPMRYLDVQSACSSAFNRSIFGKNTPTFRDEDFDTDLESDFGESSNSDDDETGVRIYLKDCERRGVTPVSFVMNKLDDSMIRMRHRCLGAEGAKSFACILKRNRCLDTIDLSDNHCDDDGCKKLAKVLRNNVSVTSLNISMNSMGREAMRAVSQMLEINFTLKTLKLQDNKINDEAALPLRDALKNNMSLESLDLSNNEISDKGAIAIAEGLLHNIRLTDLDLSWNCIRQRGICALARALRKNNTLEILDLSRNGAGDAGALAMGITLKSNKKLKVLDISHANIGKKGMENFCKALIQNKTLETLLMNTNPVGSVGVNYILQALPKLTQLKLLSIEDMILTSVQCDRIATVVQRRGNLIVMHSGVGGRHKKREMTAVLILFDRFLQEHRDTLIDLFRSLDIDGSGDVTLEELKLGFKDNGLRLTNRLIDMLLEEIDTDKSGTIEFEELLQSVAMAKHSVEKQMILADPIRAIEAKRKAKELHEEIDATKFMNV